MKRFVFSLLAGILLLAGPVEAADPTTPRCDNGVKDGEETDVDCGGLSCMPCADGEDCAGNDDCVSQYCGSGRKCAVAPQECTQARATNTVVLKIGPDGRIVEREVAQFAVGKAVPLKKGFKGRCADDEGVVICAETKHDWNDLSTADKKQHKLDLIDRRDALMAAGQSPLVSRGSNCPRLEGHASGYCKPRSEFCPVIPPPPPPQACPWDTSIRADSAACKAPLPPPPPAPPMCPASLTPPGIGSIPLSDTRCAPPASPPSVDFLGFVGLGGWINHRANWAGGLCAGLTLEIEKKWRVGMDGCVAGGDNPVRIPGFTKGNGVLAWTAHFGAEYMPIRFVGFGLGVTHGGRHDLAATLQPRVESRTMATIRLVGKVKWFRAGADFEFGGNTEPVVGGRRTSFAFNTMLVVGAEFSFLKK